VQRAADPVVGGVRAAREALGDVAQLAVPAGQDGEDRPPAQLARRLRRGDRPPVVAGRVQVAGLGHQLGDPLLLAVGQQRDHARRALVEPGALAQPGVGRAGRAHRGLAVAALGADDDLHPGEPVDVLEAHAVVRRPAQGGDVLSGTLSETDQRAIVDTACRVRTGRDGRLSVRR
jgi:hypothetical protein